MNVKRAETFLQSREIFKRFKFDENAQDLKEAAARH